MAIIDEYSLSSSLTRITHYIAPLSDDSGLVYEVV